MRVYVHVHVIGKCVFADVLIKVTRNVLMLKKSYSHKEVKIIQHVSLIGFAVWTCISDNLIKYINSFIILL